MKSPRPLMLSDWIGLAPTGERFIPITYEGTVLYDVERKSEGFASPTPAGRKHYRRMFRVMSAKAKSLGFKKGPPR